MSYGTFVKDLPAVIRREVIAYDNLPDRQGCVLYLRGGPRRIELDVRVFDHDQSEVAQLLHEFIEQPVFGSRLRLVIDKGRLAVVEPDASDQAAHPEEAINPA